MKLVRAALLSFNHGVSCQSQRLNAARSLYTSVSGANRNQSSESAEEFERRIFDDSGKDRRTGAFSRNNDRGQGRWGYGWGDGQGSNLIDGSGGGLDTLSDGMDDKLKEAAQYFDVDIEQLDEDDYSFRPDINLQPPGTYSLKDLDLTKPGVWVPTEKEEFQVTTEEVLKKADFRNVPFLANFITESGIIMKRSQTGISAKAQRKIAREIKTARAFGLMPFTTMGKRAFVFGKSMESLDGDYQYQTAVVDDFEDDMV